MTSFFIIVLVREFGFANSIFFIDLDLALLCKNLFAAIEDKIFFADSSFLVSSFTLMLLGKTILDIRKLL
jgi:hypothetical protein